MAREIKVELTGDTADFQKSMKDAGGAVDALEGDLKSAAGSASKFDGAMSKTNDGLSTSTDKFRSTADLAGGLGATLGIEGVDQISMYATGMADMADGLGGLLGPALAKAGGAFKLLNATMRANPILTVVTVIALLVAGFVLAYKKSETFRNIVNGAFAGIKKAISGAWAVIQPVFNIWLSYYKMIWQGAQKAAGFIKSAFDGVKGAVMGVVNAIRGAWNSVLGGRTIGLPKVSIPFAPDFPGFSFTIPALAKGGIVNKPTLAMIGEAGPEAVIPLNGRNAGMGGVTTIRLDLTGADDDLLRRIRKSVRVQGGNVQVVLGA